MSKETVLTRALTLLNLGADKTPQLEVIIDIQYDALLAKIVSDSVPQSLEYIVLETSIARYNRLGSEGLSSEGIDVISQSFVEDLFEPYLADIDKYNKDSSKLAKKLKLI